MQRLTVQLATGATHAVEATTVDLVAWEAHARRCKLPLTHESPDFPRITHVAFLAYSAGRRAGLWADPFDSWLEMVADLSPADDPAESGAVGN